MLLFALFLCTVFIIFLHFVDLSIPQQMLISNFLQLQHFSTIHLTLIHVSFSWELLTVLVFNKHVFQEPILIQMILRIFSSNWYQNLATIIYWFNGLEQLCSFIWHDLLINCLVWVSQYFVAYFSKTNLMSIDEYNLLFVDIDWYLFTIKTYWKN